MTDQSKLDGGEAAPVPSKERLHWIAADIVREVAELPDRTSPDDWPEAMLVTADELLIIVTKALQEAAPVPSGELESKLNALADHVAAMGISWNDTAGTEVNGEPLKLWSYPEGRPLQEHPWIAGQVLARKNAAEIIRKAIPTLLAAASVPPGTGPQETEAHAILRDPQHRMTWYDPRLLERVEALEATLATRTRALEGLVREWREKADAQRQFLSEPECLNPIAMGGMADANEARADELAEILNDEKTLARVDNRT